jgi:type IV pilus assembly protein PilY1
MELDGVWSNGSNDYLSIYNTSIENSGDCATYTGDNSAQIHSSQGNPAKISADLAAGTYYIRATYSNTACATGNYVLKSNINLDPYEPTGFTGSHDGAAKDGIGSLAWARVRIKKDKDERRGVIQETFPYVRYGFMYYKGDVKANKGKMLVGCDNKDLNLLLEAIQGIDNNASDGLDFTEAFPYGNTPTGPSLAETYDYFNQHSNSDHADNSLFVGTSTEGSIRDPYYDTDASGNPVPIPCRKSFVLLVSDGEWNDGSDPVGEAQKIHVGDVRPDSNFPDLPGDQNADIYTIYAFNDQIGGSNSMKAIAMYGGFGEIAGCGTTNFPYPKSGTPSDSKTFSWPVAGCDPTATYDETCCAEWDVVFDRNEDGIEEQKGVPDNYYEASDGVELEDSLKRILTEVISRYSSASAVATVSQELRTGDLVVRAAFDAADPTKLDRYIWWGHVEIYEPREEYDGKYDFEFNCNAGLVCSDMPGPIGSDCPSGRRCWDMGLNLRSVVGSARTIFTSINDVQVPFDTVNVTYSDLGVVDDAAAADLINWVKGDYVSGYRTRTQSTETPGVTPEWKLGDIVYSTPVVVGPPALGDVSKRDPNIESYYTYRNDNIHRKKMIYVGANDGMLHAFVMSKYIDGEWVHDPDEDPSGEIGSETWAYIPSNMLSELKDFAAATYGSQLGCTHRPAVDLAPRSWEAYIHPYGDPTVPKEWRTLVVGGQRRGGDMYFCIDVSDPDNPILLWEYSVLKHRVVVEVGSADAEDVCLQGCRADVQDNCEAQRLDCRQNCYNAYLADPTGGEKACKKDAACQTCMNNCDATKVDVCVPDGEADCDAQCAALSTGYRAYTPFADVYESIKILPMSWSRPYLTRLKIPTDVSFYVGEISADGLPLEKMTFTEGEDQIREVVFIGGGIHVYDKDFTTVPDIDPRFKLALFSPFMLLMDIQTGENLFEYVWPIVNNRTFHDFNVFPLETAEENEIPYAMSDPVALDVWNDATDRPGDDGFMDRVYVGGLNGYLYGIKFNLDETPADTSNTNMGILVDIWPTKTIDLKDDRWTNNYRGSRQPITAGLAASFEPETSDAGAGSFLRVIFGTGKYDDVPGGKDDKSDTTKMALYNLRDPVTQPVLSDTDSYEVYTAGYLTNFRVQLDLHCAEVSGNKLAYQGFNTGCTWLDPSTGDPDCCESDCSYDYSVDPPTAPCYACIYDLTHPVDIGAGERFVGKPLIAGGLVFATSYLPPTDPCDPIGKGYLYIFDYMCRPFPPGFAVLKDELLYVVSHMQTGSGDAGQTYGTVVELGEGVPSEPILDSRGDNVIIQMSDATLLKIGVNLPIKRLQTKGWIDR